MVLSNAPTCPKCNGATATDVNEVAWCVLCGTMSGKVDVWNTQREPREPPLTMFGEMERWQQAYKTTTLHPKS